MRSSRWIAFLSFLALPALAEARPYPVVPRPAVRYIYPPGAVGAVPPHVYLRERIRWHFRRRPRVVVVQPQVYVAPAPPVYVPPPGPVYVAPPAEGQPYYPPCCTQPAPPPPYYPPPVPVVTPRRARQPFRPQFGIGVTGEGVFGVYNNDFRGYGILGQLRYRALPHLTLEVMGGYERARNSTNLLRTDVPVTFGLLVPLAGPRSVLSPYFVFAGGVNFANLRLSETYQQVSDDKRIQAVGQVGFGLELRLGSHVALNGDARLEGRWNLTGPNTNVPRGTGINGQPVEPIPNTFGVRVGGGATVYF